MRKRRQRKFSGRNVKVLHRSCLLADIPIEDPCEIRGRRSQDLRSLATLAVAIPLEARYERALDKIVCNSEFNKADPANLVFSSLSIRPYDIVKRDNT